MNVPLRLTVVLTALLTISLTAESKDKKKEESTQAQAVLLDHSEYLCKNCFLGNSDYYFCFDVNSKILIGHEKVRVQTRRKTPDNLLGQRGQTVPIRYDDQYIWIPGPNGKDQRLTQDYTRKLFTVSDACQKAANKPPAPGFTESRP
ncbi:MAG: hypothetical protein ABUS49_01265 [Acidobacteriota bacterium]